MREPPQPTFSQTVFPDYVHGRPHPQGVIGGRRDSAPIQRQEERRPSQHLWDSRQNTGPGGYGRQAPHMVPDGMRVQSYFDDGVGVDSRAHVGHYGVPAHVRTPAQQPREGFYQSPHLRGNEDSMGHWGGQPAVHPSHRPPSRDSRPPSRDRALTPTFRSNSVENLAAARAKVATAQTLPPKSRQEARVAPKPPAKYVYAPHLVCLVSRLRSGLLALRSLTP